MTEKLKTLMDEAAGMVDQDFRLPDLDAITTAGDRTVRRRRVGAGAIGLAMVGAVATGALLVGGPGDDKAQVAEDVLRTDEPMWTLGRTLYTPSSSYDLGVDVAALVRTADGVAFVDVEGGVHHFDGTSVERIGTAADVEISVLVGDADGTWVGWVDDSGTRRDFVAHDLATGEEVREPVQFEPGAEEPLDTGFFLAIDGTTAYWIDQRGTTATDLATGESSTLGEPGDLVLVIGAEAGTTVRWREAASGGDLGTDVVGADGRVLLGYREVGTVGALSPTGRWVSGLETPDVWDVRTGEQVRLETEAPMDAIGYEWLDEDSLMVLAEVADDDEALRLMQCEVPSGACTDVATVDFGGERLALPTFGLMPAFTFAGEDYAEQSSGEASGAAPESSSTERPG